MSLRVVVRPFAFAVVMIAAAAVGVESSADRLAWRDMSGGTQRFGDAMAQVASAFMRGAVLEEIARPYAVAGSDAFKELRYDDAIRNYEIALAFVDDPLVIFNLGLSHRGRRDYSRALALFQQYLAADLISTTPSIRRDALALATEMAERIEEESSAPPVPPVPEPRSADREARRSAVAPVAPPADPEGMSRRRRVAIAVGVGATVSLATAAIFELRARSTYDDYKLSQREADRSAANQQRHIGQGLAGAGATLGVVAVYLWMTGAKASPHHVVSVRSLGYTGVIVQGEF